jgi:CRISPR-associated protein Csb1
MAELSKILLSAVTGKAMLRLVVNLSPANADGLVYPPTYDQGMHIFRPAWINGEQREAVLLDSVQSQANRIELAILDAHRRNRIVYPDIELKVEASTGAEAYSVLELSHRVYDAALRMTSVDGTLFAKSEIGQAIYAARTNKATALFTHAPMTLALGGWDSHGGGGPLVAKLPRLITSEIVGLDAKPVTRASVKFDPMDIRKDAGPLYESEDQDRRFETDSEKAVNIRKEYKPSEVGLGSVPNVSERGAVITGAVQTSLISLAAVRRLRFENANGSYSDDRDLAGQTVITALGLFGLIAQMEAGYYLRSGCDLIPVEDPTLEVIGRTLEDATIYPIDYGVTLEALNDALAKAKEQGLQWRGETVVAEADDRLRTLIERSRKATDEGA